MESLNRKYIPEVDQLRGAAALLVMLYHSLHFGSIIAVGNKAWLTSLNPLATIFYEGHTGVALFMVLSGYILATGTFDKEVSYWGFMKNRALRIFPLMFTVLIFALYAADPTDLGSAIAPFLLLANSKAAFASASGLSGTVWTISVEFQFYLIAPFLFLFVMRGGLKKFLLPAMLLFWSFRMIVLLPLALQPEELYRVTYFTVAGRINQFMIGIALAYLIDTNRFKVSANKALGPSLLLIGLLLALTFTWVMNQQGGGKVWQWWHLIYPEVEAMIWGTFILGYLVTKPLKRSIVATSLQFVGTISFSLYIIHYAVLWDSWNLIYRPFFSGHITSMAQVVAATVALSIPILILSKLSFHCIERPFLDMRGKYARTSLHHAVDLHSPAREASGVQRKLEAIQSSKAPVPNS